MLEQLDVRPGHRVLEIGAGTGINAALLAHLAGPDGQVTTIDVLPEAADRARRHLAAAGYSTVQVITGDGARGHEPGAPFDRIIATTAAWDIYPDWTAQAAPDARLVIPLRIAGSPARSPSPAAANPEGPCGPACAPTRPGSSSCAAPATTVSATCPSCPAASPSFASKTASPLTRPP
jgi:SAM-dependent methyltransferase